MPTSSQELHYFKTGLESLEDYLSSDVLFYPLGGDDPQLTIGGMLLAQKRLKANPGAGDLKAADSRLEDVRNKRRSAWERKAGQEVHARLNIWRNYLAEIREGESPDAYAQKIQERVVLQLLRLEFKTPPQDYHVMDELDGRLRAMWSRGAFVWSKTEEPSFPEHEFWFLYGKLKFNS